MCEPTTIMMAVGAVMQGYAAKQQGDYQKDVADYNSAVARNAAQGERNVATEKENEQRRATAELESRQRAQFAAQGVQLDTGSALAIQEDTQLLGEADAMRIRNTGDDRFNAKMMESELETSQGENAAAAGDNAFGSSLITAGAGVAAHGIDAGWFNSSSAATQGASSSLNWVDPRFK